MVIISPKELEALQLLADDLLSMEKGQARSSKQLLKVPSWRLEMKKQTSSILDAIHETASDLRRLGVIDKRSMERYDGLCIPPVTDYSPDQIKSLRER